MKPIVIFVDDKEQITFKKNEFKHLIESIYNEGLKEGSRDDYNEGYEEGCRKGYDDGKRDSGSEFSPTKTVTNYPDGTTITTTTYTSNTSTSDFDFDFDFKEEDDSCNCNCKEETSKNKKKVEALSDNELEDLIYKAFLLDNFKDRG